MTPIEINPGREDFVIIPPGECLRCINSTRRSLIILSTDEGATALGWGNDLDGKLKEGFYIIGGVVARVFPNKPDKPQKQE